MKTLIRPSWTTVTFLAATVLLGAVFGTRLTMVFAQPPVEKPIRAAELSVILPETTPVPAPPTTPPGGPALPLGETLGRPGFGPASSHPAATPPVTAPPSGPMTTPPIGWTAPMIGPRGQAAFSGGFPGGFQPGMAPPGQSQADLKFELKSQELVARLKSQTEETQRRATGEEIAALVTNHFNVRQQLRDQELTQMQDQLQKLRLLHERREASRVEIIRDRIRQLVRESEGLNWGGPQVNPQSQPKRYIGADPADQRMTRTTSPKPELSANPDATKKPLGLPVEEELKIFTIQKGFDDPVELVKAVESLLGNGPQRTQVSITTYGNKIVAKGSAEGLSLVESIINKLHEANAKPK